ncbi:MAG: Gfo/Idh/MocA family oxidoreductase [Spirosomaceae bacterium]|nr:Gfo/Idh/MocA family oxidoreductase [Spirosomataceae bacterium]
MKKLTTAIVGFGLSGRYLQAPFMLANPNYHLKCIVTSQDVSAIYEGVQSAKSIDDVLNDPEIELVSIASPSETHYELAKKVLLANKHVLVEKPFTATAAEAEELIELAKKQGKIISVFQNRRFDADFRTIQKILDNNLLGEILNVEIRYDRWKPILNPKKWKEVVAPANGILYDLGAHIIDQTLVLFGKPDSVWGQTFTQREGSEIDDAFDIRLDYGKLKVKLCSSLLVREETPRYTIHGSKGSFVKFGVDVQEDQSKAGLTPSHADWGKESPDNWGLLNTEINGLPFRGKVESEVGNWGILFQNLYEAITQGKELIIKPEEVLEQIRIIEQVH